MWTCEESVRYLSPKKFIYLFYLFIYLFIIYLCIAVAKVALYMI